MLANGKTKGKINCFEISVEKYRSVYPSYFDLKMGGQTILIVLIDFMFFIVLIVSVIRLYFAAIEGQFTAT